MTKPSPNKLQLRVTVVNDRRRQDCEGGCGLDWSAAETIEMAARRVKEQSGGRAQLELLELSQDAGVEFGELKESNGKEELSLPLLLIDGEVRISGRFDIRQLVDTIDAEMEIRHGRA